MGLFSVTLILAACEEDKAIKSNYCSYCCDIYIKLWGK